MSTTIYILCPGQGAQHVGMGKDFVDAAPAAAAVFAEAEALLGPELRTLCFDGPEDALNQTDVSQPAIFTTSVACFKAAVESGAIAPDAVAGYAGLSLGEYTALHLAGCFDFATGLKLVQARGRYMQEAAVAHPSGMVSLLGGDEAGVTALCEKAAQGDVLVPANFNSPGQIVVSGTLPACERLTEMAGDAGFRAIPLKVAGAFHSPLMQTAADRLALDLEQVEFAEPSKPTWANVTAERHTTPEQIKALLVQQITQPVRWAQTMEKLVGDDAAFVELAPGRVLTGLLKKIDRRAPVTTLNTVGAMTGALNG